MNCKIDIPFHPLTLDDKALVQRYTLTSQNRNCDMNFMNLYSWRFRYETEVAEWHGWLIFRFRADGHLAYLVPVGEGDWRGVLCAMMRNAEALGHPFLLMGVREHYLPALDAALPGYFTFTHVRDYSDYIYEREKLATLSGKKLQPKRNFANRFERLYPQYEYRPLTPDLIPTCLDLEAQWQMRKEAANEDVDYTHERRSLENVFGAWEALEAIGGCIFVDGKLVAFTYGGPINADTFDVCVEKADTAYEGAFAIINREFARRIPEQYIYINREEDLGYEGLRKAKQAYYPAFMINKFSAMAKHPFAPPPCAQQNK